MRGFVPHIVSSPRRVTQVTRISDFKFQMADNAIRKHKTAKTHFVLLPFFVVIGVGLLLCQVYDVDLCSLKSEI
jgi:hypothetical protein